MTGSRASILASIQKSLHGTQRHLPEAPTVVLSPPPLVADSTALAAKFAEELARISGTFIILPAWEIAPWLAALLKERGTNDLLAWQPDALPVPGVLAALRAGGVNLLDGEVPAAEPGRSQALARIETAKVGLTGVDAAFAETGTLALWTGPGRPRLASLSVRTHVALLDPRRLFASWAAWLQTEGPAVVERLQQASNLALIGGPSRTGDIEMTLTVGVHGPGQVIVILVSGADVPPAGAV
ncbi:MAG: lactate utilization protein [Anaerolineales bacterium]